MSTSTVLVVDDDDDIRQVVCFSLQGEGYRTLEARHGVEALACLEAEPVQVILLDMRMPVMDGWTFAREMRARGYGGQILVMAAGPDPVAWASEVGAAGVLPKPFGIHELLGEVKRLCAMG